MAQDGTAGSSPAEGCFHAGMCTCHISISMYKHSYNPYLPHAELPLALPTHGHEELGVAGEAHAGEGRTGTRRRDGPHLGGHTEEATHTRMRTKAKGDKRG